MTAGRKFRLADFPCKGKGEKVGQNKVGRASPIVIWPEFRMEQNRKDDHWEDAPHFSCQSQLRPRRNSD